MADIIENTVNISDSRRVTLSDVHRVARGHILMVDQSSLEKCDEASKRIAGTSANTCNVSTVESVAGANVEFCRAAVCARVVSLLLAHSVRSNVIIQLMNMLNKGVVPVFSSEESAGEQLLATMTGVSGNCYRTVNGETILQSASDALASIDCDNFVLLEFEKKALLSGHFFTAGIACYLGSAAKGVYSYLDCVAAFSCEAVGDASGLIIESIDAQLFDTGRQHRGQMQSAANLRMLLEGSQRVVTSTKKDTTGAADNISDACLHIPQVHGPVQEVVAGTLKMLEIELNGFQVNANVTLNTTQIFVAMEMLIAVFDSARVASAHRVAALKTAAGLNLPPVPGKSTAGKAHSDSSSVADNLFDAITGLSASLHEETVLAVAQLDAINALKAANAKAAESDAEQKGANRKVEDEPKDDPNMSEAVRRKIEEKRRKKAEQMAKKAEAKASKKSSGVILGVGTSKIQEKLKQVLNSDAHFDVFDAPQVDSTQFHAFCAALLVELGSGGCRRPKICKGARDFGPESMRIREQAFSTIRSVFKRHGAVEIDTPVFELKEVLMGKYGEDSKLIYDLADQGGELLCLRYDLTVPFARFLAMNTVGNIKRFHIAKVYRRDQPQPARGRYREFYQCDIDIAGNYSLMVPDAEVISVCAEILSELPIGNFLIKLNHRKILDAVFEICGVPAEKFRTICSAVDKLDKETWEAVKDEMVNEKGLAGAVADRIGEFVLHKGKPKELWSKLTETAAFGAHEGANVAMSEMKILFEYLDAMGSLDKVQFDLSLARGLDYYTGVIYEAVLVDGTSQVGSIAAGGRYDNLVGMFSISGQQTPCVGVSIGVERVMAIMEQRAKALKVMNAGVVSVFVASIGEGLVPQRMRVAKALWSANFSAEYSHQDNPKFKKQLDYVLEKGIPYVVVFGEEEVAQGVVKVKDIVNHTEEVVPLNDMVEYLVKVGCTRVASSADPKLLTQMREMSV